LIVPADTEFKISVQSNHEVCIRADGQIVDCPIDTSGLIFKNEGRRARVLHNPNWNFFEMLSTKLGWKNKS
jgi:NAD kinase